MPSVSFVTKDPPEGRQHGIRQCSEPRFRGIGQGADILRGQRTASVRESDERAAVLNNADVRGFFAAVINPVARGLLRIGVSPDAVTLIGALGAWVSALAFFTTGHFLLGSFLVLFFVLSDLLDGTMARISGRSGPWGAFLDSVLDRMTDGILVGSVALYLAMHDKAWSAGAAIIALVAGQVVSYAKARGESVGLDASGGVGERAERLIVLLVGTFLTGFGVKYVLEISVWVLAALSLFTVGQRVLSARRSSKAQLAAAAGEQPE